MIIWGFFLAADGAAADFVVVCERRRRRSPLTCERTPAAFPTNPDGARCPHSTPVPPQHHPLPQHPLSPVPCQLHTSHATGPGHTLLGLLFDTGAAERGRHLLRQRAPSKLQGDLTSSRQCVQARALILSDSPGTGGPFMRLFLLSVRERPAETRYRGELMEYKQERNDTETEREDRSWESKRGQKRG